MNARANRNRADVAHARGIAQSVYNGRILLGYVHPTPRGFLAEDAEGKRLGTFPTAQRAAHQIVLCAETFQ